MYIAIIGRINGDVIYFGPFKTEERAKEYATLAAEEMEDFSRWFIKPLVVPHRESKMFIRVGG